MTRLSGPFNQQEIQKETHRVYRAYCEELQRQDRFAASQPWEKIGPTMRQLWRVDVHAVMLGGVSRDKREWVRELVKREVNRNQEKP